MKKRIFNKLTLLLFLTFIFCDEVSLNDAENIAKNLPTKYFTSEKLAITLSTLDLLNLDFPKSILSHSIFSK